MSGLLAAFSTMPGFARLDPAVREQLVAHARAERLPAGRWLVGEGDVIDHPVLIVAGTAGVYRSVGSRTVLVGLIGAGTLIGQIPTLHAALPYSAVARSAMTIARFPALGSPTTVGALGHFLLQLHAAQMATMLQRTTDRANLPPLPRVAAELAYLTDKVEPGAIAVSQQELGEMIGLSRKTVNRCLGELERRGAITAGYGVIAVIAPALLATLAEDAP